jgi:hypothetical protein
MPLFLLTDRLASFFFDDDQLGFLLLGEVFLGLRLCTLAGDLLFTGDLFFAGDLFLAGETDCLVNGSSSNRCIFLNGSTPLLRFRAQVFL